MTLVAAKGGIASWVGPPLPYLGWAASAGAVSCGTIDAATEKVMFSGYVWWTDGATHTVSSAGGGVYWYAHTPVTFNNASTNLRVGLQDLHATNYPAEPDGTFDVHADLVGGTDTITTSSLNLAAFESGTKSVAHLSKLAVVLDMTAKGGADSVIIAGHPSSGNPGIPGVRGFLSGAWGTAPSAIPALVLVADDGTLGYIVGANVVSIGTTDTYQDSTNPDERGNVFTPDYDCKAGMFRCQATIDNVADDWTFDVYADPFGTPTSIIGGPVTFSPENYVNNSGSHEITIPFATSSLMEAGTDYVYAIKATGTSTISIPVYNYGSASHSGLVKGAPNRVTRNGGSGAFTETTTQLCAMWLGISHYDDGTGSGSSGGGIRLAGHGGLAA